MTRMPTPSEIAIPTSRGEAVFEIVLAVIIVFFSAVAVCDLLARAMMILSCVWLAIVALGLWAATSDARGLRKYLVIRLGVYSSRQFAQSVPRDAGCAEIRFGYELLGRRLFYLKIPVDKIETVEWWAGQATSLAGRDMNDWMVSLWYDHDGPDRWKGFSRRPNQDIYIVGPSRKREDTAAFGLSLVEFLCEAGASLSRGEGGCTFVRVDLVT